VESEHRDVRVSMVDELDGLNGSFSRTVPYVSSSSEHLVGAAGRDGKEKGRRIATHVLAFLSLM
jgi:hypothetical protein